MHVRQYMGTYLESMKVRRAGTHPADTTARHTYSVVEIEIDTVVLVRCCMCMRSQVEWSRTLCRMITRILNTPLHPSIHSSFNTETRVKSHTYTCTYSSHKRTVSLSISLQHTHTQTHSHTPSHKHTCF